eukprot:CAMPEP_0113331288 /NCGR_PEP_ID=MMETSP0010_2-20120614/22379_1 /TAXON_ID=216773 ORGANISM="Corethron hystrix, Strain 308" /NCGR_SAMPLE_ID=MMETSP0010_2 /ASSEMBLY_ACC=CAM_ASM_000155 /LENGTH=496 /DNA_ID=CAMNT_0000194485 /DNA_START=153 /DNA_END=1640 /DNA_ORIENTATION=- /assembly_acc=CAM_ASM_000155
MYTTRTIFILCGMVITGAGRIVAVKAFFQMGSHFPLFVTLLYLLGQSFSLGVYAIVQINKKSDYLMNSSDDHIQLVNIDTLTLYEENNDTVSTVSQNNPGGSIEEPSDFTSARNYSNRDLLDFEAARKTKKYDSILEENLEENPTEIVKPLNKWTSSIEQEGTKHVISSKNKCCNKECSAVEAGILLSASDEEFSEEKLSQSHALPIQHTYTHRRRGSGTGLTLESKRAVAWIHQIPWYVKPMIPGFFNLCNAAMRWGSLIFMAASTAEMLLTGLELVLSVIAARILRKRKVSMLRWTGTCFTALGIILVGLADIAEEEEKKNDGNDEFDRHYFFIGNLLIVGQCFFSVIQDLAEEVFLQETDFPATLLLGMEGAFGFLFGIPIYFCLAAKLGETPIETLKTLASSRIQLSYCFFLVFLFAVAGIFNIVSTEVTSSMTRNVWKNFRTVLVWAICLFIFYFSGNKNLGEQWIVPGSWYVLGGFLVMVIGVYVYYAGN